MFLFFFIIVFSLESFSQITKCYIGTPNNSTYEDILDVSPFPMVKKYRDHKSRFLTEGGVSCRSRSCLYSTNLSKIPTEGISKSCIISSLKRKVTQDSFECRYNKDKNSWGRIFHSKKNREDRTPCIENRTADYIHYVVNEAIDCFNYMGNGYTRHFDISPKWLFAFLNNESGFNFAVSSKGGVGVGQLTSSAVQEMNIIKPSSGKPIQEGGARFILDNLLRSPNSSCSGFQSIIKDDKKNKFWTPRNTGGSQIEKSGSHCEWVSLENGLPRTLIYAMGYYSFLQNQIENELERQKSKFSNNEEVVNLLTLVGYGPNGINQALALIRTAVSTANGQSQVVGRLSHNGYLRATRKSLIEAKAKYADLKTHQKDDTCSFLE